MELALANKILRNTKSSMLMDGYKVTPNLETDGLMILLGKINPVTYLNAKIEKYKTKSEQNKSNKLGLNASELSSLAPIIIFVRLLQLTKLDSIEIYDNMLLQKLHKKIFSDIFYDAGVFRKTNDVEGDENHPNFKYVSGSLKTILSRLNQIEQSPILSKSDFAMQLTHYTQEINILSPFSYGNGIVRRLFFQLFSNSKGFSLDYYKVTYRSFIEAQKIAYSTDDILQLYNCLNSCTTYYNKTIKKPLKKTDKKKVTEKVPQPEQFTAAVKKTIKKAKSVKKPPSSRIENKPQKSLKTERIINKLEQNEYNKGDEIKKVSLPIDDNAENDNAKDSETEVIEPQTENIQSKALSEVAVTLQAEYYDSDDYETIELYNDDIIPITALENAPYDTIKKAYKLTTKIEKLNRKLAKLLESYE